MANFGPLTLIVYDQALSQVGQYFNVLTARGTSYLNRVGNGEVTLKVQSGMGTLVKGNIIACYIIDTISGGNLAVCAFTIEEIHKKTKNDGMSEWRLSGRDLLGELSGYPHFVDIGNSYDTYLVTNANIGTTEIEPDQIGTVETDLFTSPGSGHGPAPNPLDVDDATGFNTGDPIVVQLDADSGQKSHLSTVISTTSGSPDTITIQEGLPSGSSTNRKVTVPEIFMGGSVAITQDGGTIHHTRVTEQPGPERLKIKQGMLIAATAGVGAVVSASSPQNPTLDDITDIMALAVADNWTLDVSDGGTANRGTASPGTGHAVDGASTVQLLTNANELTSEWFRWDRTSANAINRTLAWKSTSDASGITLLMSQTQAAGITDYADTAKGIIHSLTSETRYKVATAVVPKGATDDFNISDKTDPNTVGYPGSYAQGMWTVTNTTGTPPTDIFYTHYVTFNGVEPETTSLASEQKAANELYRQAVLYLQNNAEAEEFKRTKTVIHADILPGQWMTLAYSEAGGLWSDSATVYVSEVSHSVGRNGVRYTDLLLSETAPYNRETAETRLAAGTSAGGAISSGGGGAPSSGGGVTDHGALLGLADDDHPQYLLADGTRNLFGNLAVDAGITIDGTDISVHVVDVDAHHDPVTAGDHISLSGQQISVTGTADARSNPAEVLISDADGRIRLDGLRMGNVASASDHLVLDAAVDAQGEDYVASGAGGFTTQWKIDTGIGAAYFAYLEADQMHIRLFQADVTMAKGNGLLITDSVGVLSDDFLVPAVSATVPIIADDNPELGDAQIFEEDDWVFFRAFNRVGGVASSYDLWGQVTSYSDNSDATQDWTLTIENAGVGSGAVGKTIRAGSPVIGYGKSGSPWMEFDARREQGPFMRNGTWAGDNPYTPANRNYNYWAGRLLALTGVEETGFYAGVSILGPHVIISDTTAEFQDVGISMREGTADGGYIALYGLELNSDVSTAVAPNGDISQDNVVRSTGSGTWFSHIDNDPTVPGTDYIRATPGEAGNAWFDMEDIDHTLTTLEVEAYITNGSFVDDTCQLMVQMFKADGVTKLTDEVKIASELTTNGLVTIPFTGLVSATDGEWAAARLYLRWVYFVAGSDEILTINTDDGITIRTDPNYGDPRSYSFFNDEDEVVSRLSGRYIYTPAGENNNLKIDVNPFTDFTSTFDLNVSAAAGEVALLVLTAATASGDSVTFNMNSGTDEATLTAGEFKINANAQIVAGLYVGDTGTSATAGQIILDQGTLDGTIISARSDDVTGMTTQGMDDANTYFQVQKHSATTGGALLKGGSESINGILLRGSANNSTSTLTTAAAGPVQLSGQVDDGPVGAGNNCVVMKSDGLARWILQGEGNTFQDGTMSDGDDFTPDYLDDVMAARAIMLLSDDAVRTEHDNDVTYTREDLEREGIVTGKFKNRSRQIAINSGALWQLHKRILELEARLGRRNIPN